jgi:hypothetical protein
MANKRISELPVGEFKMNNLSYRWYEWVTSNHFGGLFGITFFSGGTLLADDTFITVDYKYNKCNNII